MQLIRHTMYDKAWIGLCDAVPLDARFNVRYVLEQLGIPQGSHDRLIKRFETQEGHRIKRVEGTREWVWDFSADEENA